MILHGDCLELLQTLPDKSVDMILTDLPYGKSVAQWDKIIPMPVLWQQFKRVTKPKSPIILFGVQPFTSMLVASNPLMYRTNWVWVKERGMGFLKAKVRPLQKHEDILVFGQQGVNYYPIMVKRDKPVRGKVYTTSELYPLKYDDHTTKVYTHRYPNSILEFSRDYPVLHQNQKPVALLAYLINTYSLVGDIVLDTCGGSGSTAIAAINTQRNYIIMEKDKNCVDMIEKRVFDVCSAK